jgi:ADP-ribose pyrophosphatase YjhB (NUDIX family)
VTASADPAPEPRKFARFAEGRSSAEGYWPLPPDGLCLSAFVLLHPPGSREKVLVGKLDPEAPWDRIGALDPGRVHQHRSGWMIPSSHLLYFEPPEQAARRILSEQLGRSEVPLEPAGVFSETYLPRRHPGRGFHWDLEFLFRGTLASPEPPKHPAWTALRFLDPSATPRAEFARSHDEVLELAGYRIG